MGNVMARSAAIYGTDETRARGGGVFEDHMRTQTINAQVSTGAKPTMLNRCKNQTNRPDGIASKHGGVNRQVTGAAKPSTSGSKPKYRKKTDKTAPPIKRQVGGADQSTFNQRIRRKRPPTASPKTTLKSSIRRKRPPTASPKITLKSIRRINRSKNKIKRRQQPKRMVAKQAVEIVKADSVPSVSCVENGECEIKPAPKSESHINRSKTKAKRPQLLAQRKNTTDQGALARSKGQKRRKSNSKTVKKAFRKVDVSQMYVSRVEHQAPTGESEDKTFLKFEHRITRSCALVSTKGETPKKTVDDSQESEHALKVGKTPRGRKRTS